MLGVADGVGLRAPIRAPALALLLIIRAKCPHRSITAAQHTPTNLKSMLDISELAESEAPPSFYCPISRELMTNPVTLADGHSYERAGAERWLRSNQSSPKTGAPLQHRNVTPNHALRNAIEEFIEKTFKTLERGSIVIGREIGAGSFKTVHEGTLRSQPVAVMRMRAGFEAQEVEREIKVLIKLRRHPNLVR